MIITFISKWVLLLFIMIFFSPDLVRSDQLKSDKLLGDKATVAGERAIIFIIYIILSGLAVWLFEL